ncbi:hypothetical protein PV433_04455 [Paenibacillus sp. GYB004]|uniref:hypothetical protein n=1 Tax=Paenibacillus sp. GYB004 TaxID=2994393 RepID=UPI002F96C4B1
MKRHTSIRYTMVLTGAALLLAGLSLYDSSNPESSAAPSSKPAIQTPSGDSQMFDPASIRPGDQVAGMTAQEIRSGTYGLQSVAVTFQGTKEISGRFEVMDLETQPYNPGDVIFYVDNKSATSLPKPIRFHEVPNHFVLKFANETDKAKFGSAGSTGTGSIVISDYLAVYADILEGTSDKASLTEVKALNVIAPSSPEENNPDFDKEMKPFPILTITPQKALGSPEPVYEWIEGVHRSFYGLAYNGKRISEAQRERVKSWLAEAFTDTATEQLADSHVPAVDGGYLIVSGSSGLIPPVIIQKVGSMKMAEQEDGSYLLTADWIVTGVSDARLICELEYEDGRWKISTFHYEMI